MSKSVTRSRQAIVEAAADWFVQLQEKPASRSTRERFAAWLTESPVHVEEYLAIAKVFDALGHVDPQREIDVAALADETIVAMHGELDGLKEEVQEADEGTGSRALKAGNSLVQPDSPEESNQTGRSRPRPRTTPGRALAQAARNEVRRLQGARSRLWASAAMVVLAVAAAALYVRGVAPEIYATALGEQRSVLLEDGSMISLNTSTRIEVAFTDETRQVRLVQGEALFDIEKDVARPFLVETGSAMIRVTGTKFNVYEQSEGTAVTVLRGEVEVRPRTAAPAVSAANEPVESARSPPVEVAKLTAGRRALVKSGSAEIETTTVTSLEPVTAWTERRLVFDSTPLSDIVQQFNRYNHKRLVLDDPSLASLELSGVFGSNDPEVLVLFLQRVANVEVVTSSDGSEIRIHAANTPR